MIVLSEPRVQGPAHGDARRQPGHHGKGEQEPGHARQGEVGRVGQERQRPLLPAPPANGLRGDKEGTGTVSMLVRAAMRKRLRLSVPR